MKVIASLVCVLLSSQSIKARKMKDLLVFSLLELCFQDNVNVYISVFFFFFLLGLLLLEVLCLFPLLLHRAVIYLLL